MVLRNISERHRNLTQHEIVVVARSNVLRYRRRPRESVNCACPPPTHCRKSTHHYPLGDHRPFHRYRTRLLVYVDPTMHAGFVLLGENRHGKLYRDRLPYRHCLPVQCGGYGLRFHTGSLAYCLGVESADEYQDKGCFGGYS